MSETVHKIRIWALVVLPFIGVTTAVVLLWNRYVFWSDIALFGVFYALTTLGVTIGFHRMLTHRSFDAPEWLRMILLILGTMAFDGVADEWAATHIKHHAHSDEEDDPHSPHDGFWHAHLGWLFHIASFPEVKEYAPHLLTDRTVQFVSRTTIVWLSLSLLIPYAIGGWTGLLWGGAVRIFLVNHVTWSVNSVCHCFGKRDFETTDESRNHWIVGLLAFGEGWHNNHHAFPQSAVHGLKKNQFDLSGFIIQFWEKIGLVKNVHYVSPEVADAKKQSGERMREAVQELKEQIGQSVSHAQGELRQIAERIKERYTAHPELPSALQMNERALDRLREIQRTVTAMQHAKKQTLLRYREEAAALASQAKKRLSRLSPQQA